MISSYLPGRGEEVGGGAEGEGGDKMHTHTQKRQTIRIFPSPTISKRLKCILMRREKRRRKNSMDQATRPTARSPSQVVVLDCVGPGEFYRKLLAILRTKHAECWLQQIHQCPNIHCCLDPSLIQPDSKKRRDHEDPEREYF